MPKSYSVTLHGTTNQGGKHRSSNNRPFMTSQKSQRGSGAPVGFINLGSPMDPLPYKTRPSRRRNDSTRLGRPRYTITGQDHDPVPNRYL